MGECTGWLLDVYADTQEKGLVVWVLEEGGERCCLRHRFPVTFYAAGRNERLRALWRYLQAHPIQTRLARTERRDLFRPQPLTVMEIRVEQAAEFSSLFGQTFDMFSDLSFYDCDIPLLARFAAAYDVFPLLKSRFHYDEEGYLLSASPLESRWDLDPEPVPLRVLRMEPNCDPAREEPTSVLVHHARGVNEVPLQPARPLLAFLRGMLHARDPDLILTRWGDTWLIPRLLRLAQESRDHLPLNRDPTRGVWQKSERSVHSYGQVYFRGGQALLFGRFHIDSENAMLYEEYGMEGILELARVTGLPVQVAARNSPGSGITTMQTITALKEGILVPYRSQQVEDFKTASSLIYLDQGGMVYQPTIGLHENVGEVDFISMYPSIIRRFKISPEKMTPERMTPEFIQSLEPPEDEDLGLLPRTLNPLLEKRIAMKIAMMTMDRRDARYRPYKNRAAAMKWLLVVSFGYTGYRNAVFGKIEAHQAITAYAREILLLSKAVAEGMGFTVLHMYVDGLWVKKRGCVRPEDFTPLVEAIAERTGLSLALDGVLRWVAFLPSRADERVAVPNRYFGVFQDGEVKTRGIEDRRDDTPPWVGEAQDEILSIMVQAPDVAGLNEMLPQVVSLLRARLRDLREGNVPLEKLVVRQTLSRELEQYKDPSPAALAAAQLESENRRVRVGQKVALLFVQGEGRVRAWNLSQNGSRIYVDIHRYSELLLRAAETVMQPLGIDRQTLRRWVFSNASAPRLPNFPSP